MCWLGTDGKEHTGSQSHAQKLGWCGDRGVEHGPAQQPHEAGKCCIPSCNTELQHHSQSSQGNVSYHHQHVTFCELWPAWGHECSCFEVTQIPISRMVFSAQSFTSCAQYPPLLHGFFPFFIFFLLLFSAFLPSLTISHHARSRTALRTAPVKSAQSLLFPCSHAQLLP